MSKEVFNQLDKISDLEESKRFNKVKKALFGDPLGKIRTFVIISAENPLGWRNATDDEFKDKYIKWANDKKKYNKETINNFKSDSLRKIIDKTGDATLKLSGASYVPIKGFYAEENEKSFIIFNITLSDAKILARDYGQESFFFANVYADRSSIAYYETADGGKTYKLVDIVHDIETVEDAVNNFSKFGFKWKFNLNAFDNSIPKVANNGEFEESFNENSTFRGRATARRHSREEYSFLFDNNK